jgi:outer membrane cobalamin receptor
MRQKQRRKQIVAGVSLLALLVTRQVRGQAVDPASAAAGANTPTNGTVGATGAVIPKASPGSAVYTGKNKSDKAKGTKTKDGKDQADTIVVTGIRGSLNKSIRIKRDSAVVLDSINSTELGRFPDSDVADSLQHITGITINRTTGGEGQYVSVRGLGSAYNITTLNDRLLATDDDGRDFAFDILPADVISGADVLKSPQASALEGSIGGTVNLRAAGPSTIRVSTP